MYQTTSVTTDINSRWKGRIVSVGFHGILLLAAFLPFLTFDPPERPSQEALILQFEYPYNAYIKPEKFVDNQTGKTEKPIEQPMEKFGETSKMSGSEAGGSPEDPQEAAKTRPQMAAPATLASASNNVKQVVTTPSPIVSASGILNVPTPKIQKREAWASVSDFGFSESDGVKEMRMLDWSSGSKGTSPGKGNGDGDDDSDITADGFGTGTGGRGGEGGGPGAGTGKGSGPGGGTGAGGAGDNTGVGQNGKGLEWGVGIDGALDRELAVRANVGALAKNPGKVSFMICVDRAGKVISAKYDLAGSSLRDPDFAKLAEDIAMSYVFKEDQSAPEKQCGKLTFVFKLPK